MFVGSGVFEDGGDVDSAFMGEGGLSDIGRVGVRSSVEEVVKGSGEQGEVFEFGGGDGGLEAFMEAFLKEEGWEDADEVRVSASFSESVDCALDLSSAGADGGEGVGDGLFGVVMGVDSDLLSGDFFADFGDDFGDFVGLGSAVGVAEDDPFRACVQCGVEALHSVLGVGFVSVKEVFGVHHGFFAFGGGGLDRFCDIVQIFFEADGEGCMDVEVPAFGDEADGGRGCVEDFGEVGVVFGGSSWSFCHSEGGEAGCFEFWGFMEEGGIGGVCAWVSAFYVVYSEVVEHFGDGIFFLDAEVHAVGLLAVAEGCVEDVEAFFLHG